MRLCDRNIRLLRNDVLVELVPPIVDGVELPLVNSLPQNIGVVWAKAKGCSDQINPGDIVLLAEADLRIEPDAMVLVDEYREIHGVFECANT